MRSARSSRCVPRHRNGKALAEEHHAFARKIARDYFGRTDRLTHDEIVSAALLGLVLAERRFDPSKGFKFLTYAVHYVHREIQNAFTDSGVVRTPRHKGRQRVYAGGSRFVSVASLDEPLAGNPDVTMADVLASDDCDPYGARCAAEREALAERALAILPPKHAEVLRLRFGFHDDGEGMTLADIGKVFGLSRERIRQLETEAFEMLRHPRGSQPRLVAA